MSRKKIFLHIGTFKTGSTSLQFHMHKNNKILLENGFYYGDYFDKYYLHSNLSYGLLKEALIAFDIFEKYKNHPRFINVAEKPEEVIQRMISHAGNCSNIIISHEGFFADAFRTLVGFECSLSDKVQRDVNNFIRERLRELLQSISDEITIVCYLRRQDSFIESQYNQYCKDTWYGEKESELPSFQAFVDSKPIHLNYFDVLEEWKQIFSDALFIIKPYEKSLIQKNLITDFYQNVLGIDPENLGELNDVSRSESNVRLDRNILEYKKELKINDSHINLLLKEYSLQLEKIKDYAYFSKEERQKFMDKYSNQNEMVARKYLLNSNGHLFEDKDVYVEEYPGLQKDAIFHITKWLILKLCDNS